MSCVSTCRVVLGFPVRLSRMPEHRSLSAQSMASYGRFFTRNAFVSPCGNLMHFQQQRYLAVPSHVLLKCVVLVELETGYATVFIARSTFAPFNHRHVCSSNGWRGLHCVNVLIHPRPKSSVNEQTVCCECTVVRRMSSMCCRVGKNFVS